MSSDLRRIIEFLAAAYRRAVASGNQELAEFIAVALIEAVAREIESRKDR